MQLHHLLRAFLIGLLKNRRQYILFHQYPFCLFHDPHGRIQIQKLKVIIYDLFTEAVNGRNAGPVDQ